MRVRGGSPGRPSGGSAGDRGEPRAIAGLIYSAGDEKRSVPNAWREIQRRTMRLTNAGGPEAIVAVSQGATEAPGYRTLAASRHAPPHEVARKGPRAQWRPCRAHLQNTDACRFCSSRSSCPLLPGHVLASRAVPANAALRRDRAFAGGLPVRHGPPIAPLPDRRGARRFYCGQQRGVDFRHPPELGHALGNRDETIRQIRLQPHEFEVLAQCFLMLAEAFADLSQALPRLGS